MINIEESVEYKTLDYNSEFIVQFKNDYDIFLHNGTIHFGAFIGNEMIGILSIYDYGNISMIVNFYVIPLFRCMGIGTKLLQMANLLENTGEFVVKYNSADVDVNQFNSFLYKNNWSSIKYDYSTYELDWRSMTDEEIRAKEFYDIEVLSEFDCRNMGDMSHDDLIDAELQSNKLVDRYLSPFGLDNIIPQLSTFVYIHQTLVGWIVVIEQPNYNAYIKSVYVKEKYRLTNLGLFLMMLTINRLVHNKTFENIRNLTFCFDGNNKKLRRFYKNMCEGHITKESDTFVASKTF